MLGSEPWVSCWDLLALPGLVLTIQQAHVLAFLQPSVLTDDTGLMTTGRVEDDVNQLFTSTCMLPCERHCLLHIQDASCNDHTWMT